MNRRYHILSEHVQQEDTHKLLTKLLSYLMYWNVAFLSKHIHGHFIILCCNTRPLRLNICTISTNDYSIHVYLIDSKHAGSSVDIPD